MADRLKAFSTVICSVQFWIGVLTSIEIFYALDSLPDMVLGMPQLYKVNLYINWTKQTIRKYRKYWWVSLPMCGTDHTVQLAINIVADCESYQDPIGPHKMHLESTIQFNKSLKKADEVFVGFVSTIGECNFTHHTAHSDVIDIQLDPKSEALLDEMQQCYPKVFEDPQYPITENHILFSIQLVDEKLLPPKRKLYPLSEPKLQKLREYLKDLLDSGRIVPQASLYEAPILFVAKKI